MTMRLERATRPGAILPVEVRTARKRHVCDDCQEFIERGDKYELSATPPHRLDVMDVDCWLIWRTHYPRHDGHRYLPGCDEAAAYHEKAARARQAITPREDM